MSKCTVQDCNKHADNRKLCWMHYSRLRRHGSYDDPRPTVKQRFEKKFIVNKKTGCWEWIASKTANKYAAYKYKNNQRANRVAYELYVGSIPDNICVCHNCDNPLCVNPDHLFLGTAKDNMQDMLRKGRGNKPTGEQHGMSKLKGSDVIEIKRLLAEGITGSAISRKFNVSFQQVSKIKLGTRWKNI